MSALKFTVIYDKWMQTVVLEDFSLVAFCDVICQFVSILKSIRDVNVKVLGL